MTTLLNKIKSMAIVVMLFSFFATATISSCTPKSNESEGTEAVEADEHPSDTDAAAVSEEHPSDSTATQTEEHPSEEDEDEEHPTE